MGFSRVLRKSSFPAETGVTLLSIGRKGEGRNYRTSCRKGSCMDASQCESSDVWPNSMTIYQLLDLFECGDGPGIRTSEKAFPHPMYSQWWGFSPVCVRMCTVKALLWIKLFPQSVQLHEYGLSFVCIR